MSKSIPETMRAWQCDTAEKGLELNTVPVPTPKPGFVLLKVRAVGLCHSDISYMKNASYFPKHPMTEGHEIAGEIVALGENVEKWQIGDRVGVCPSGVQPPAGVFTDGGYADYYTCPAVDLARVPDELSWELAAAATDAGMTSYHAIMKRGNCQAGMKVGVIGFGGLGQIATRAGVLSGAEVHVCEVKKEVWPLIEATGVLPENIVDNASAWTNQNFDLIVDFAGYDTTVTAALSAVKRRMGGNGEAGTVVLVGMGTGSVTIQQTSLLFGRNLIGSLGGTVSDIEEIYELMAQGDLNPHLELINFDEIPAGLKRLNAGKVEGRLVAVFGEDD